jgi:DNA-binding ferritin-like protein (Dps family)
VGIGEIVGGKRQWRAHLARVRALPRDYQIVYKQVQRYLFKVGAAGQPVGPVLSGIVDFFEDGAARGQGVLDLTGTDVAGFCDDVVRTHVRD